MEMIMNKIIAPLIVMLSLILSSSCERIALPEIANPNIRDTSKIQPAQVINLLTITQSTVKSGDALTLNFKSTRHKSLTNNKVQIRIGDLTAVQSGFLVMPDTSTAYKIYSITVVVPGLVNGSYPVKITVIDGTNFEYQANGSLIINNGTGVKSLYLKSANLVTLYPDTAKNITVQLKLYDKGNSTWISNSQISNLVYVTGTGWTGTLDWGLNPSIGLTYYKTTGYEMDIYVNGNYTKTAQMNLSGFTESNIFQRFSTPTTTEPYDFEFDATFEWK